MNLYCIIGYDSDNSEEKRKEHLESHLLYLRALNKKGHLLAAGPLLQSDCSDSNKCGSMLLVSFKNLEDAKNWFANEPYNKAGIYKDFHIYPYKDGLPYC